MGSSQKFPSKKEVLINMVGMNSSGKNTILYQLKTGKKLNNIPQPGIKVETFDYKGFNFKVCDVGLVKKIRVLWKQYYQNADGLIFVIDSNDRDRIDDAAEYLKEILEEEELKNCCVLVMANKQDLNGAMTPNEVIEKLEMGKLKGREWLVQGTSAINGQGVKEGLDWMVDVFSKKINN